MATPFRADESLDVDGFQKSMRFMAEAGCDGATIVGVLGESNRMTDRERETLIRAAVDAVADCGRPFPICVGTSHAGTAATVALSQMAQELGAAAVMVTPTKEPAPASDDTLAEMYARVAEGCPGLPIVLQDHPASTQARLEPGRAVRGASLGTATAAVGAHAPEAHRADRARGARRRVHQARGAPYPGPHRSAAQAVGVRAAARLRLHDPDRARRPLRRCARQRASVPAPPVPPSAIRPPRAAGFDMEQGTDGFMTGFAFPEILQAMNAAAQRKEWERAHALYQRYLPLLVFEQQPGVAVRKELYRLRGLIECAHVRHPAAPAAAPALAKALAEQVERSLPGIDVSQPLPASLFA